MMEMMEMMQAMTNAASDSDDPDENAKQENGMQMPGMEALLSMLGPEQQAMIELLKGGMQNE